MVHFRILRRPTSLRRALFFIALLLALAGWLGYLGRPAPAANAQVTTVIDDAATPVSGRWQSSSQDWADNDPTAVDSQKYRLWAFKNFDTEKSTGNGYFFRSQVFCAWNRLDVYDAGGNLVDIGRISFDGETSAAVEDTGSLAKVERMERIIDGRAAVRVDGRNLQLYADFSGRQPVDSPYEKTCYDLNVNADGNSRPLEENLDPRPDFLLNNAPPNSGWLTPEVSPQPADWSHAKRTILDQEPFLVLGNTRPGGGGFTNHSLELNLWVPAAFDLGHLALETADLCDGTDWDTGLDGNAYFTVHLEGRDGRGRKARVKIVDETNCASDAAGRHDLAARGIDVSSIGQPIEKRSLVTQSAGVTGESLYHLYKIIAAIDVLNANVSYTNQFRIAVANPDNSYLGIGKTDRDSSGSYTPATALSASSRLPAEYDRLEVFWESWIYLAADADKGCSGSETENIGFYDSDYPFGTWKHYKQVREDWLNDPNRTGPEPDDMKPRIDIYSADRNLFHNNQAVFPATPDKTLYFDGRDDNGRDVSWNDWEYEDFNFRYDKIYRLHLRNIDQRTWIQVGLPYDQVNALQKCVDKPLVKVYHGGVSVGGRFGSGKTVSTCRDDDLSLGGRPPGIYAHAELGENGSSAEYSVQARGMIDGFYSNFKRGPPPAPANGLTFANTDDPWGGNLGGRLRCIPNWWRRTDALGDPLPETNLSLAFHAGSDAELFYEPDRARGGRLSLSTGGLADLDLKAAVYVEGDLLITENILNPNSSRSKLNQLKTIYLIVRGDILIHPDVTRIDAVLVAMPTDVSQTRDGRIFTCYVAGVTDGADDLHGTASLNAGQQRHAGDCLKQLTVNGALAARQIRLGRVTSSAPVSPAVATQPVAEVVNLLPEYHVAAPPLPAHSEWYYNSDSVSVLPINF